MKIQFCPNLEYQQEDMLIRNSEKLIRVVLGNTKVKTNIMQTRRL